MVEYARKQHVHERRNVTLPTSRDEEDLQNQQKSSPSQSSIDPSQLTPHTVRHLQGQIGNQAVQRLIAQRQNEDSPSSPVIQRFWGDEEEDDDGSWFDSVTDTVSDAYDSVTDTAGDIYDSATDTAGDAYDWASDTAGDAYDAVSDAAGDAYDWASDTAGDAYDTVSDAAGDAYDWASDKAGEVYDQVSDTVSDGVDWVTDKAGEAYDWATDKASDGVDWVTDKAGDAYDWATDKADKAIDWASEHGDATKSGGLTMDDIKPQIIALVLGSQHQTIKGFATVADVELNLGKTFMSVANTPGQLPEAEQWRLQVMQAQHPVFQGMVGGLKKAIEQAESAAITAVSTAAIGVAGGIPGMAAIAAQNSSLVSALGQRDAAYQVTLALFPAYQTARINLTAGITNQQETPDEDRIEPDIPGTDTPPVPPGTPGQTGDRPTLKRGSRGDAVRDLQTRLNQIDTRNPLTVDGIFGRGTQEAVEDFQEHANLVVDGIVGPNTWDALLEVTQP